LAETCNGLQATIVGTDGDDVINGTNKMDVIVGLGGSDIINSKGGDDVVCAGDGDDIVNGGNGDDTIFGEAGDDQLNGEKGDDNLDGGLGNDQLVGGKGSDSCDGYVGQDSASGCQSETNVGLQVKQVQVPVPGGFTPVGGDLAGQLIPALDGALFVPRNSKKIAILATHSASGVFFAGTPGWLGWWMEQNRVTVLALNRRDSAAYGANEGGGGTIYEDTLCDAGLGVDYLISLGYEQVIIEGFSKGTTVAPMYPVYYNNCPGKTALTDPNDPNVAGVVTNGTIRNNREAGEYAPYGPVFYDLNILAANDLVSRGFSGVLFPPGGFPNPPFPPIPEFGPKFFAQPPGFPFFFPIVSTPDSYVSYNDNPLRNTNETAKDLVVPYLIIHTEGDQFTLRFWSDTLFAELQANGNDVEYFQQPYASLGYDLGFLGGNAHGIANQDARDEATAVIGNWASRNIPGANAKAKGIDQAAIDALLDFNPPLQPAPVVP
jgi:Ca2+-binding RTX toxin-like protein